MKKNFKWNFDIITDWTVLGVNWFYKLIVQNLYFVLSNLLFITMLFVFQLTLNNFLLFIIPIFLFYVSLATQFKMIEQGGQEKKGISFGSYRKYYHKMIKNNWKIFLFYTFLTSFIIFEVKVLWMAQKGLLLIPLLITASFLASGMFFVFLLSSDERASQISIGQKFFSMLLVSYKLPFVTVVNMIWIIIVVFALQRFSLAYLLFLGGAINYMICLNLKRRFSVQLYFEQIGK